MFQIWKYLWWYHFYFISKKPVFFVAPSPCFVNKEVSPDWFISGGGNGARARTAQGRHVWRQFSQRHQNFLPWRPFWFWSVVFWLRIKTTAHRHVCECKQKSLLAFLPPSVFLTQPVFPSCLEFFVSFCFLLLCVYVQQQQRWRRAVFARWRRHCRVTTLCTYNKYGGLRCLAAASRAAAAEEEMGVSLISGFRYVSPNL